MKETCGYTARDYRQMPTRNGVAFTATLLLDGKAIGAIEQLGNGGATLVRAPRCFEDAARKAYPCEPRTCDVDLFVEDILQASGY